MATDHGRVHQAHHRVSEERTERGDGEGDHLAKFVLAEDGTGASGPGTVHRCPAKSRALASAE